MRLLRSRTCGLVALWLRLDLPMHRLPWSLFVSNQPLDVASAPREPPIRRMLYELHVPITAAAALATNHAALLLTSKLLGMSGGAADIVLQDLPYVLAATLPLRFASQQSQRHTAALALRFLGHVIAPTSLAAAAAERHAELIEALVCSASSLGASALPLHPTALVVQALHSEAILGSPSLGSALGHLPKGQLHRIIIRAHAIAIAQYGHQEQSGVCPNARGHEADAMATRRDVSLSGDGCTRTTTVSEPTAGHLALVRTTRAADLAPLEILISHGMIGDDVLRRGAVPHLLQSALCDALVVSYNLQEERVGVDAINAAATCARAAQLLKLLHATMPAEARSRSAARTLPAGPVVLCCTAPPLLTRSIGGPHSRS